MKILKTTLAIIAGLLLLAAIALVASYQSQSSLNHIPKGWSVIRGSVDQWTDGDGKIHVHSSKGEALLVSSKEYRDLTLSAVCNSTNREASLAVRMEDADNGYVVIFAPSVTPDALEHGLVRLIRRKLGQEQNIGEYRGRIFSSLGSSAKITVSAKGPWIEVSMNDVKIIRLKDTTTASGFIGLRVYGTDDYPCDATFSDLSFH